MRDPQDWSRRAQEDVQNAMRDLEQLGKRLAETGRQWWQQRRDEMEEGAGPEGRGPRHGRHRHGPGPRGRHSERDRHAHPHAPPEHEAYGSSDVRESGGDAPSVASGSRADGTDQWQRYRDQVDARDVGPDDRSGEQRWARGQGAYRDGGDTYASFGGTADNDSPQSRGGRYWYSDGDNDRGGSSGAAWRGAGGASAASGGAQTGTRSGYPGAGMSHRGRGPKGYIRSDARITEDVNEALAESHDVDASDITVRVESGVVTLDGSVDARWMKHRAEDLVEHCSGVKDVDNRIKVKGAKAEEGGGHSKSGASAGSSSGLTGQQAATGTSGTSSAGSAGTPSTPGSSSGVLRSDAGGAALNTTGNGSNDSGGSNGANASGGLTGSASGSADKAGSTGTSGVSGSGYAAGASTPDHGKVDQGKGGGGGKPTPVSGSEP